MAPIGITSQKFVLSNGTRTARLALEISGNNQLKLIGSLRKRKKSEPFFFCEAEKLISLQQAKEMLSVSGSSVLNGVYIKMGRYVVVPGTSKKLEENISVHVTPQIQAGFANFLEKHI